MRRVLVSGAGWSGVGARQNDHLTPPGAQKANNVAHLFARGIVKRTAGANEAVSSEKLNDFAGHIAGGEDSFSAARAVVVPRDAVVVRPGAARYVIPGNVRVKKNSLRRIRRGNRTLTISSAAHQAWEAIATLLLRGQQHRQPSVATWGHLNLCALIYLEREPGLTNLDNLIASVMDALQAAGVVADDCLIRGFDGSRIRVDRTDPRVEIVLSPLED